MCASAAKHEAQDASSSTPTTATRRRSPSCDPRRAARHRGRRRARPRAASRAPPTSACCCQYPTTDGDPRLPRAMIAAPTPPARWSSWPTDLLALTLLTPPGELGADIASARASASACRWASAARTRPSSPPRRHKRQMPGRIIGVSRDATATRPAPGAADPRAAHPPREGDSNICTAQVLLASWPSMYAVYHGPEGLRAHRAARPHGDRSSPPACALGATSRAGASSTPCASRRRAARHASRRARSSAGINLRASTPTTVGVASTRPPRRRRGALLGVLRRRRAPFAPTS
jgi:glycine cleavage system pyridoxal-binding protein P